MKKLQALVLWLEGKKTYLVSLAAGLDGLYQFTVAHGLGWKGLLNYLLLGGGLASLRAAVSKI